MPRDQIIALFVLIFGLFAIMFFLYRYERSFRYQFFTQHLNDIFQYDALQLKDLIQENNMEACWSAIRNSLEHENQHLYFQTNQQNRLECLEKLIPQFCVTRSPVKTEPLPPPAPEQSE
jgi:hypothetical protein